MPLSDSGVGPVGTGRHLPEVKNAGWLDFDSPPPMGPEAQPGGEWTRAPSRETLAGRVCTEHRSGRGSGTTPSCCAVHFLRARSMIQDAAWSVSGCCGGQCAGPQDDDLQEQCTLPTARCPLPVWPRLAVPTLSSTRFRRAPMVLLPRSLLFSAEQRAQSGVRVSRGGG